MQYISSTIISKRKFHFFFNKCLPYCTNTNIFYQVMFRKIITSNFLKQGGRIDYKCFFSKNESDKSRKSLDESVRKNEQTSYGNRNTEISQQTKESYQIKVINDMREFKSENMELIKDNEHTYDEERELEENEENINVKNNKNVQKGLPEEFGFTYQKHEPTMFGDWCHNCRVTDF